ncbi:SPOR domain-containing protein, partial [Stella sp.]|uniref:SPOR domain-containing protein n=1 Tax=Stella sp. TaxID=2912054 RepID=UPI0035B2C7B2
EAAQQEWDKMKAAHAPVLGRLTSQIVRVDLGGERGVFFRIQAGPYGDADAARRACAALKERNVSCLVVRP